MEKTLIELLKLLPRISKASPYSKTKYFSRARQISDITECQINDFHATNIDKETIDVASHIFSSHVALPTKSKKYTKSKKKKKQQTGSRKIRKPTEQEKVSFEFHSYPAYRAKIVGTINGNNKDQIELTNHIFSLLEKKNTDKLNKAILIRGDIGSGKSTLMSNVFHKLNNKSNENQDKKSKGAEKIAPIIVDFEFLFNNLEADNNTTDFIDISFNFIKEMVCRVCNLGPRDTLDDAITQLEPTTNVILLIDNLDAVYDIFCKYNYTLTENRTSNKNFRDYYPYIYNLLDELLSGEFSELGINIAFFCRLDTFDLLNIEKNHNHGKETSIDRLHQVITLQEPDSQYFIEIMKTRFNYLRQQLDKKSIEHDIPDDILNFCKVKLPEIHSMSAQGLRHAVEVYKELSWCYIDKKFTRFKNGKLATWLYFYLGNKSKYSQTYSQCIVNIFLVNSAYRKSIQEDDENKIPDKYLVQNLHTYWLKYLILITINSENIAKDELIELFSPEHSYKKYCTSIVRLVLFSLSQVEHGRLIRPKIAFQGGGKVTPSGIIATRRAKYMLENKIFFSFIYLSLIIEDEWLEWPLEIRDLFQETTDYTFIFSCDNESYNKKMESYILKKIPLVLLFFDILKISYSYEKKKSKDVFLALEKRNIKLPDFESLYEHLIQDIDEITLSIGKDLNKKAHDEINKYKKSPTSYYQKESLKKFFKKAYLTRYRDIPNLQNLHESI